MGLTPSRMPTSGETGTTSSSSTSLGFQGDGRPLDSKPESEVDIDVDELTFGEVLCIYVEVEPGKFVRKCERIEKTMICLDGRPVEVVKTAKELSEADVTGENLSLVPFADKYIEGRTSSEHSNLIACEVDVNRFKLPEVPNGDGSAALAKRMEELNKIAYKKQLIANNGKDLSKQLIANNGKELTT